MKESDLLGLIARLVEGIRKWASEEDGVPDWMWEDYKDAVDLIFPGAT